MLGSPETEVTNEGRLLAPRIRRGIVADGQ
jgi:hypothetical protein